MRGNMAVELTVTTAAGGELSWHFPHDLAAVTTAAAAMVAGSTSNAGDVCEVCRVLPIRILQNNYVDYVSLKVPDQFSPFWILAP